MQSKPIFTDNYQLDGGAVKLMRDLGRKVVILSATRTPFTEVGGEFKDVNPIDLGAWASKSAIAKAGLEDRVELIPPDLHRGPGNAPEPRAPLLEQR